ncbi:MAG: secY [Solirubrobacterales bacterium]|nr:secY [Solirubrobacterales bacterium]
MASVLLASLRHPGIRAKLAFTMALLFAYRLGSFLPAPGVNLKAIQTGKTPLGGSSILGLLNLFSGGGLGRISLFALGVAPYVTASIVMQLLGVVVPSMAKLRRDGEVGEARLVQYTRYLTVGLAAAQSLGYVLAFRATQATGGAPVFDRFDVPHVLLIVLSLTAGAVLLMWIGELITNRGIGNGISLLIMAGILAALPGGLQRWWTSPDAAFKVIMPFIVLSVIASIVFIQSGERRVPVQYAKRVISGRLGGGGRTFLPLRLNMAGVIPVIFAATLMALPPTASQYVHAAWAKSLSDFFRPSGWPFVAGESLLILAFTFLYTAVTFNPVDQADSLRKYGGFIPGVRPGGPTAAFLDRILTRLTFPGGVYLALVAALPTVLIAETGATFAFGGTSLLIVIGVALETVRQLEAQLTMRSYETYLKDGGRPRGPARLIAGGLGADRGERHKQLELPASR